MNTNIIQFMKLKNQKNEEVYTIDNINDNLVISPLKPIINIFDKLTLHGTNDECVGEINFSEIFLCALAEAVENKLGGEDSSLKMEINKTLNSTNDIMFRDATDCFPELEVRHWAYEQPNIQQVLNESWGNKQKNPLHRTEPKIGRNDPCPCGSGKKYKKCCLN